jgi:predicted metalloprotease with PDZ domain|tara:strand:+ start:79 stop:867 length:789 start_codon:yes stop_codon:yes gene_type:complete
MGVVFSSDKTHKITTTIKTEDASSHQTRVEAHVDNNVLKLTIEKDGEKNTYEVDLKDIVELDAIRDLVDELDIDINIDSFFDENHSSKLFENRAFLGVHCEDISDQLREYFKVKSDGGVLISEILDDSPAEQAGLKAGDVIIEINDDEIWDSYDLTRKVQEYDPEEKITVKVIRKGRVKKINVILGERDELFHVGFNGTFKPNYFKFKKGGNKFNKRYFDKLFEDDEDFIFEDADLKKELKELKEEIKTLKDDLRKLKENSE